MKLRRAVLKQDLRDMPIDHGDMFLMSRVEDLVDVAEVVEVAPWEAAETKERLGFLVKLGLLEWVTECGEDLPRRDTLGEQEPSRIADAHLAVTLRPQAPLPIAELFRQTEHSVIALRVGDGLVLLDQAVIREGRSVFTRVTLVDDDEPTGNRQLLKRPRGEAG